MFVKSSRVFISSLEVFDANYFEKSNISMIQGGIIVSRGAFGNIRVQNFTLLNSTFTQCYGEIAGALYLTSQNTSFFSISNCTFTHIYSAKQGAAFFFEVSSPWQMSVIISSCRFRFIANEFSSGAVLFATSFNNQILIESSNFSKLYSGTSGGFLYVELSNIILKKCILEDSLIEKREVPLYFETLPIITTLGRFANNLIYAKETKISFIDCIFKGLSSNNLIQEMAIFAFESNTKGAIFNCTFENITFSKVFFQILNSELLIMDSNLTGLNGGESFFSILNSRLEFRKNVERGFNTTQGSFIDAEKSLILISASVFENSLSLSAPILKITSDYSWDQSQFSSINDSNFTNNSGINGPGVAKISNSLISIINCSFIRNFATLGHGGALQFDGQISKPDHTLILMGNLFSQNSAIYGGALFYSGIMPVLKNNTFKENKGILGEIITLAPENWD